MASLSIAQKLSVLADAAKYDASCASSGTVKRHALKGGLGSTDGGGICHAYTPDGRCISLLKILFTNACIFDCAYCINRSSSNVQRARFTVDEVVALTVDFYRRNYIEGLFLSSGIIRSADHTMELLAEVARKLREEQKFHGYIHLKTIAGADQEIIDRAARYADRMSVNIELPTAPSLERLAPDKTMEPIRRSMAALKLNIDAARTERKTSRKAPRYAPAGQSTQMIIGADASLDVDILTTSTRLYSVYGLKRVYYSAFSPIPDASTILPLKRPPLLREHRIYQADWLLRFYGFDMADITHGMDQGMFDLAVDPKLAWALKSRALFPVNVNSADRETLLRVPGFGVRSVNRLIETRRHQALRYQDVARIATSVRKAQPFFCAVDWHPGALTDSARLEAMLRPPAQQLELFA